MKTEGSEGLLSRCLGDRMTKPFYTIEEAAKELKTTVDGVIEIVTGATPCDVGYGVQERRAVIGSGLVLARRFSRPIKAIPWKGDRSKYVTLDPGIYEIDFDPFYT